MDPKMNPAIAGLAALALAMAALAPVAEAQRSAAGSTKATTPPTPPAARKSSSTLGDRTTGFTVGVYTVLAPGVTITGEDVADVYGTSLGPGAGVRAGYGFNKTWSAYASLDVAKQSTSKDMRPEGSFGLAHFEIGARANLPIKHPKILPYVNAALGNRALAARVYDWMEDESFDWSLSGGFFALGGGLQYFLSPKMSLDGGLTLGFGSLNKWTLDGDTDTADVNGTKSLRLRTGVTWRP